MWTKTPFTASSIDIVVRSFYLWVSFSVIIGKVKFIS